MANTTRQDNGEHNTVEKNGKKNYSGVIIFGLLILSLSLILVAVNLPEIQLRNFISKLRTGGASVHVVKDSPEWLEYISEGQITLKTSVVGIHFGQYPATDETMQAISNWSTLQSLSMQKVDVSEQAISELLVNCPDLINLQILSCPKIGPVFVKGLRTKYPRLTVNYRGVAYLGVSAFNNYGKSLFCRINFVQPGMPAQRAGLLKGDILTTFAGHEIKSFDDLVHHIGKQQPGDVVEIKVNREFERGLVFQCTLTDWEGRLP